MWMTLQSSLGLTLEGSHGTAQSMTRIASAAFTNGVGIAAGHHRMMRRHRDVAVAVFDDRDRVTFGERGQRRHHAGIAAAPVGDDHGMLRPWRECSRPLRARRATGAEGAAGLHAARARIGELRHLQRQHLARQRQIDRALGIGHRHASACGRRWSRAARRCAARSPTSTASRVMPPWSYISCVQWMSRERWPFSVSSLVGVRPAVNSIGTWPRAALSRPFSALAVPTLTWCMVSCGRPDDEIVADRHVLGGVLVRAGDGLGMRRAQRLRLGQRLDHRREIGAGVGEQIVDAAIGQQREIGVGDGDVLQGFGRHGVLPVRLRTGGRPSLLPHGAAGNRCPHRGPRDNSLSATRGKQSDESD